MTEELDQSGIPEGDLEKREFISTAHAVFMSLIDDLDRSEPTDRKAFKAAMQKAITENRSPTVLNRYVCDAIYLEMEKFFRDLQRLRKDLRGLTSSAKSKGFNPQIDALLEVKTAEFLSEINPYVEALTEILKGNPVTPAFKILATVLRPSTHLVAESDAARALSALTEIEIRRGLQSDIRDNDGGGRSAAQVLERTLEKAGSILVAGRDELLLSDLITLLARVENIPRENRGSFRDEIESMSTEELRSRLAVAGLLPAHDSPPTLPQESALRGRLLEAAVVDTTHIPEMPMAYPQGNVPVMVFNLKGEELPVHRLVTSIPLPNHPGSAAQNQTEMETVDGISFAAVRAVSGEEMRESQDVCGVILDAQTKKVRRFAVSDGVGSCEASLAVAQKAVYNALLKIAVQKPYDDLYNLANFIQKVGISLAASYDQEHFLQSIIDVYKSRGQMVAGGFAVDRIRKNPARAGSTTLLAGLIEDGYFYDAHLGDGGRMIFGKNGDLKSSKCVHTPEGMAPKQINLASKNMTPSNDIMCERVSVEDGDRAFVFTDGLFQYLREKFIISTIQAMIEAGKSDAEICYELTMMNRPGNKNWRDDVAILGFTI